MLIGIAIYITCPCFAFTNLKQRNKTMTVYDSVCHNLGVNFTNEIKNEEIRKLV